MHKEKEYMKDRQKDIYIIKTSNSLRVGEPEHIALSDNFSTSGADFRVSERVGAIILQDWVGQKSFLCTPVSAP